MNLIFDFDGTICDSIGSAIEVVNKILIANGIEPTSIEEVRKYGAKGLINVKKIPLRLVPKLVKAYRAENTFNWQSLKPFKGMAPIIKRLSKVHNLGILTTNSQDNVRNFLGNHGLRDLFTFIDSEPDFFGKDKALKKILKKHNLSLKDTYYIGDETRDSEAARKVGIKAVSVTWGAESEESLTKSTPAIIVNNPKDLLLKLTEMSN